MRRVTIFLLVLGVAEIVWRIAGDRFVALNAVSGLFASWLHPDMADEGMAYILPDYSHAAWLLLVVVLAGVAMYLTRAPRSAGTPASSRRVGMATAALVVVASLLLISSDGVVSVMQTASRWQDDYRNAHSKNPVLALVGACHDAIRKHFAGKPIVTIDSGLDLTRAYIYTYEPKGAPNQRIVGLTRTMNDVSPESVAPSLRTLMPPIEGSYLVEGLVDYSGDNPAVNWTDLREYHCVMVVKGGRYEVRDLRFNLVR